MVLLKRLPDDFVVREVSNAECKDNGAYAYFELTKRNFTTLRALSLIADALRLPLKRFGYAGLKDKRAVTVQMCSVRGASRERLESLQLTGMDIRVRGFGDRPISLGQLAGNRFAITVRGITKRPETHEKFINYFGEQRFSRNNPRIGRAIVRRDFEKACTVLIEEDNEWSAMLREHLAAHAGDYIGALRHLPLRLLLMFVHSFQALLWNKAATDWSARENPPEQLVIPGFGTETMDTVMQRIVGEEGITTRDFIVRGLPELSVEGGERALYECARSLKIGDLEPDTETSEKKVALTFFLPKGSYATVFVQQLFGERTVPGITR